MVLDLLQNNFFIQHFLASNIKNICWISLKRFTIQHLISNTVSNINVFERLNFFSNVFIKSNKRRWYLLSSQFYSTNIMSSEKEETCPAKGHAFKAHMKDKEKQEKDRMGQDVWLNNKNL